MRHSIAEPVQVTSCWRMVNCSPAAMRSCQLHQVESGDQLRHRMLHLQARIHFEEIEVAIAIHQEFQRARVVVAGRARDFQRRFAHLRAQLGMLQHHRRRALLDHFLMPPLDGAFALAQMNQVAVMIAQNLDFDVPRLQHQLFRYRLRRSGTRAELRCGHRAVQIRDLRLAIHAAHAFAASARRGFQQHRIAQAIAPLAGHHRSRAEPARCPEPPERPAAIATLRADVFEPILRIASAGGPMNTIPAPAQASAKSAIFTQESIAGMNRVRAMTARRVENFVDAQIAF